MPYLFKQKLQISDLVDFSQARKKVLIVEPESGLAALYARYLNLANYQTYHCVDLEEVRQRAQAIMPHVLVLNIDKYIKTLKVVSELSSFKIDHPELHVITFGLNVPGNLLIQLMRANISGHFDRKLGRPQDIVALVGGLFYRQ